MANSLKREKSYWLGVLPHDSFDMRNVETAIGEVSIPYQTLPDGTLLAKLSSKWENDWKTLIASNNAITDNTYKIAIIPSENIPDLEQVEVYALSHELISKMADNYWLIDYLENIESHFQKIINRNKELFGFEAFARITTQSGEIISGGRIMAASEALNIKHIVDRLMLIEAVKSFKKGGLEGMLFLNFAPGFIQKPEKYLEGLDDAVKEHGLNPSEVVFDINKIGNEDNIAHLIKMSEYCKTRGYLLSLDDVSDLAVAEKLINDLKPEIMKLDKDIVQKIGEREGDMLATRLINLAHSKGCIVLAEGIETQATLDFLHQNRVDLFQGYFIGKPERA